MNGALSGFLTVNARYGKNGSPLPMARVLLYKNNVFIAEKVADLSGKAILDYVPAGTDYLVEIKAEGFMDTYFPEIKIMPERTTVIDGQLFPTVEGSENE